MLRIFIDPALASTVVFAIEPNSVEKDKVWFLNPKVAHKTQPKLPGKYILAELMADRIQEAVSVPIANYLYPGFKHSGEIEIYIEAPFVGSFGSTVELVGLSFLLLSKFLTGRHWIDKKISIFMISASMVSGKDKKAKRERKARKPFAVESARAYIDQNSLSSVYGVELLPWGSKDDVATAFLLWYYVYGPGVPEKAKDKVDLQRVEMDTDLLSYKQR